MDFYTTRDVLEEPPTATPQEPVTIDATASIQDAVETMFDDDLTQLLVDGDDRITAVTLADMTSPRFRTWLFITIIE